MTNRIYYKIESIELISDFDTEQVFCGCFAEIDGKHDKNCLQYGTEKPLVQEKIKLIIVEEGTNKKFEFSANIDNKQWKELS